MLGGKVTCKKKGETKEEYANRWAEHFLLMVRDWADDYIAFTIQQKLRNKYENDKDDAIKAAIEVVTKDKESAINFLKSAGIMDTNGTLAKGYVVDEIEQNPAWSEEDENEFNHVIKTLKSVEEEQETKGYNNLISSVNWLKSLRDRVQLKQKWSEKDDKKRKGLIKGLEDRMGFGWANDPFSREEYIYWLKSLKPQNKWKPNEEQLEALNEVMEIPMLTKLYIQLSELFNELKKLRG